MLLHHKPSFLAKGLDCTSYDQHLCKPVYNYLEIYSEAWLKYTCCMIDRNECLPDTSAAETSNLYHCCSEAESGDDLDRNVFGTRISLVIVSTDGV